MIETEKMILTATIETVALYGMRKTSVGDIAARAGLSRQTVYKLFASKEEIYRAAIDLMGDQWREKAQKRLDKAETLSQKFDVIFDVYAIGGFKFGRANKDAHDILAESEAVAFEALQGFFEKIRIIIAETLEPYAAVLRGKDIDPDILADQIELAIRSYKRDAKSLKHLQDVLDVQRQTILLLADQA